MAGIQGKLDNRDTARRAGHRFVRLGVVAMSVLIFPSVPGATAISPRVQRAVVNAEPIWVFLKDKGPSTDDSGVAGQGWISARAGTRIARGGGPYDPKQGQPNPRGYRHALISSGP